MSVVSFALAVVFIIRQFVCIVVLQYESEWMSLLTELISLLLGA